MPERMLQNFTSITTRRALAFLMLSVAASVPAAAQGGAAGRISEIRYELRFDASLAAGREVQVGMRFRVADAEPVLLSMPAWTPGAYEISNFARHVRGFRAEQNGRPLRWDKFDFDTWRVRPGAAGEVRVEFRVLAEEQDNAKAWAHTDFVMLNGTNVFPYPEGQGLDFGAEVGVVTEAEWLVATGMRPAGRPNTFREANYHDLVDMPFFIGRLDVDSTMVDGRPYRLASWPAGALRGPARQLLLAQMTSMMPPMHQVFGETPWQSYTTLLLFDESFGGGSALEHQNSHVGIYHPGFIGTPILASITAHEIFHAWNVKRLRPAEMVPYRYDVPQPTVWLWVSEGVTDYYADLALVRGGIVDSTVFLALLSEKLTDTEAAPPVALEDASLTAWISPTDGTSSVYYPKGALAGFLLDIMIRDASDNRRSLDDVLRTLYLRVWKAGRGFTGEDWWGAVREAAGGKDFREFASRYIDGREPFPWSEMLPLAGLRLVSDTTREARIGVTTETDSIGSLVIQVAAGSSAAEAGVDPGDYLLSVGEVSADDQNFGLRFRARYGGMPEGTTLPLSILREGRELTLPGRLRFESRIDSRIEFDPRAGLKARRIRSGLLGR